MGLALGSSHLGLAYMVRAEMTDTGSRYTSGEYLGKHPTWHAEDSAWKAAQVRRMMDMHGMRPTSIGEVGCGAGGILRSLHDTLPYEPELSGYEISPQAFELARHKETERLRFELSDLLEKDEVHFDLLLVMDVIEHVEDYFAFLRSLKDKATYKIFHIPLDLSSLSVARPHVLLETHDAVGHIHFFTRETALQSLRDTSHEMIDDWYTFSASTREAATRKERVLHRLRTLTYAVDERVAVRLFGGYSLLVLAR